MILLLVGPAARHAMGGTDDYPAPWRAPTALSALVDDWGYSNRNCTSFVAFRLHSRAGFEMPRAIGDAQDWAAWARSHGYVVNGTPAVGAVADWWTILRTNHVSWVEAVNSDDTVTLEEYNWPFQSGDYHEQVRPITGLQFIHFRDTGAMAPAASRLDTIASYYRDFLGREPDSAGLASWNQSGLTLNQIRSGFLGSEERRHLVEQLYDELLWRTADPGGLDYWRYGGLSMSQIRQGFIDSSEYRAKAQIKAIYLRLLGRPADRAGLDAWFRSGLSISQVSQGIRESDERRTIVERLYSEFLGRPADAGGLDYWRLSDRSVDEIRSAILDSDEYKRRHAGLTRPSPPVLTYSGANANNSTIVGPFTLSATAANAASIRIDVYYADGTYLPGRGGTLSAANGWSITFDPAGIPSGQVIKIVAVALDATGGQAVEGNQLTFNVRLP